MYYDMSYKLQYKIACIIYAFTELYIMNDIYEFGKIVIMMTITTIIIRIITKQQRSQKL